MFNLIQYTVGQNGIKEATTNHNFSNATTLNNVFKAKKPTTMYLTVTDKNVALAKM